MKGFLHQLFDYTFYCTKKLIDHFNQMEAVPEQCLAELQTNGLETFPLDYIFYKR